MKKYIFAITLAIFFSSFGASSSEGINKVVNLSGKQRMLTQKMSKEALLVALEIDKVANLENLKATSELFNKTLVGLEKGDADLGLPPTKKPHIKKQLGKISGLWDGFQASISNVVNKQSAGNDDIKNIADNNLPLLKAMNKAVKLYEAQMGSSGDSSVAVAINLSGKQRMLTQKMSKEFFLISFSQDVAANKKNLIGTIKLFDKTLNGLINGSDELGLIPAPNNEIKSQLNVVQGLWQKFKPVIEKPTTGTEASEEDKKFVAENNLPLLKEMNKAVKMYEKL